LFWWNLRFSHLWPWGLLFSMMWYYAVCQKYTNVSGEHDISIFRPPLVLPNTVPCNRKIPCNLLAQTRKMNDTAAIDASVAWNLPGSCIIIYTAYLQWNMSKITPDFHTPAITFYQTFSCMLQCAQAMLIVCTPLIIMRAWQCSWAFNYKRS